MQRRQKLFYEIFKSRRPFAFAGAAGTDLHIPDPGAPWGPGRFQYLYVEAERAVYEKADPAAEAAEISSVFPAAAAFDLYLPNGRPSGHHLR